MWGGSDAAGNPIGTGAKYNPTTNTWIPMRTTGAPAPRSSHTAIWDGSRMIIGAAQVSVVTTGSTTGSLTGHKRREPGLTSGFARSVLVTSHLSAIFQRYSLSTD